MANDYFTEQDFEITDTTATIERPKPPVEEEEGGLLKEAKAIGIETLPPAGIAAATSPLLTIGPKGWLAYGALNMASGMGFNWLAQEFRDPGKNKSFKEMTLNGIFSAVPGLQPTKTAQLSKRALMGVRAAETGVMAGGEEFGRQVIDIYEGDREALDPFSIGFATVIGSGMGYGLGGYEHLNFRRAGVSKTKAEEIQKIMQSEVADRINYIDDILKKNPELGDGEMGRTLLKEREDLSQKLTEVSRTDREYIEQIRKQAQQKKQEAEEEWAKIVNEFKEEKPVGAETVLRPKEDVEAVPPVKKEPKPPSKLTTEQKLQALERMNMSDEELLDYIEGKTDLLPINVGALTGEPDIQKSMAAIMEQVKDGFKKRGVKTDKASLLKRAAELKQQLDPSVDPLKYTQSIANKSEELIFESFVADSMTLSAFKNFRDKLGSDLNFNDPAVLNDLFADMDRLTAFGEATGSIGSNAGKMLQSRKVKRDQFAAVISEMERDAVKVETELQREFVKYSKDLSPEELNKQIERFGGLKALRGLTNEMRVLRDTGKLSRLLEIRSRGVPEKLGAMGGEVAYDLILSGPVTQAAAFTGNISMALYSLSNQALGGLLKRDLKTAGHAITTARNLLYAAPDAWRAAMVAAKHSKGQMGLDTHYERIGGKAFSMEETGLKGAVGESVENIGELMAFGPKGLVFQDEFFRHMFAKAQTKALLTQEYKQLVKSGEHSIDGLSDYIEGGMSRYFVDGKRYKTENDVVIEAVEAARKQGLEGDEYVDFVKNYTKENWTEKLSSEMEYLREFGDRITFQQDLEKGYGFFETIGTYVQDARQRPETGAFLQLVVPFIKTPVNIFKEFGGTTSALASIPGVSKAPVIRKMWARTREELTSENPSVRAQARGRQVVGAGLWASAVYLANQKILTGSGPSDYYELQNLKNEGWQENSINVSALERMHKTGDSEGDQKGDEYVSLQRLDPLATLTGVAADLVRMKENNDVPDEELNYLIHSVQFALMKQVGQKSYLETVGSSLEALTNGRVQEGEFGNVVLETLIRRATPSMLNAIGRSDDPYMRQSDGPLEVLYSRLPGYMKTLDRKRDAFGQPVLQAGGKREDGSLEPSAIKRELNFFNPATLSQNWGDEATEAITRVRGGYRFPDPTKRFPGIDLRKMKVTGSNQSLYDRWQQIYSETDVKDQVVKAYKNPFTNQITRPRKGNGLTDYQYEAISNTLNRYQEIAAIKLIQEYPELLEQYKYNTELNILQLRGEELPEETVAPELQELIK